MFFFLKKFHFNFFHKNFDFSFDNELLTKDTDQSYTYNVN